MTRKLDSIHNIPADRALKLNVNGAGNYRVEYDEVSWKLLLGALKNLGVEDRVNLLCDTWALVQANRAPIAVYFELVEKLPASTELAEREQIIHVLDFINRLLSGSSEQEKFQRYARSLLRPTFDAVGWETKPGEQTATANLRASLITALGNLNDPKIVANCREHFKAYLAIQNRSLLIFGRRSFQLSDGMLTNRHGMNFTSSASRQRALKKNKTITMR